MISEDRTRKPSIDAAVAKELKRRKFAVWCLWGLIVVAFTLTGWILYQGKNVTNIAEDKATQVVEDKVEQVVEEEVKQVELK